MSEHDPLQTLQQAWHDDAGREPLEQFSPEALERRARRLSRQVFWRNVREWAAAGLVVVLFSAWAYAADRWLTQLGAASTALAALWIAAVLLVRGRNLPAPPVDAPSSEFLRHLRAQLERQAKLLEGVPTWYALPIAAGTMIILADKAAEIFERGAPPVAFAGLAASVVVVLSVYVVVIVLNRRAARELRERIERGGW